MTTTLQTWTIGLPYLEPPLTANQRLHWTQRAARTKGLRESAHWLACAARIPPQDHVTVGVCYRPRDNRRRDADNLVPTLKAACDGIVDAGVVPDDTPRFMSKLMPVIHPADKQLGPALWLEVTA